jgi:putative FmdB family regulatory protein
MPIYQYECEECKATLEIQQKVDDLAPKCHGDGGNCKDEYCQVFFHEPIFMTKIITKTSFVLKGQSWARDNYGKGKTK